MLSEWMKAKFFTRNPIETLLIRNKKEYTVQKYLDNITVEDVIINDQEYDERNLTKD